MERALSSPQNVQGTYDKFSSFYDLLFKRYLEQGREKAIRQLAPTAGTKVLEIGVGTGLSFDFYPEDIKLIAFDYSLGMLKVSKKKGNSSKKFELNLLQMDAQNMAFKNNTFDRILAAYVLTVVPSPEDAIDEIFRVARPGAKVIIVNHLKSRNKILGAIEDVLHPMFSGIGLFNLNRDLITVLSDKGAKNIKVEPATFLKTHHIIAFEVPDSLS